MDLVASTLLAAVLWADGFARVSGSTMIIRRVLAGPWRVHDVTSSDTWRPLSWWPPLSITLALRVDHASRIGNSNADVADAAVQARLQQASPWVRVLRGLGICIVLSLVIGAPAAVERYSALGLLVALAWLGLLGCVSAVVAAVALHRLGATISTLLRSSLSFAWPFFAPRAAETVLIYAIGATSPVAIAQVLLTPVEFCRWARPLAYDLLAKNDDSEPRGTTPMHRLLHSSLTADQLRKLVASPPSNCAPGAAFCPRCGGEYQASAASCTDCDGVALRLRRG